MDYFERLKARMARSASAYTDDVCKAQRPFPHADKAQELRINQIVDLIIGCRTMGLDFEAELAQAKAWASYEWEIVEPALKAKREAKSGA